jgi:hypothetical protein
VPTLIRFDDKEGAPSRFTRACWTCMENGRMTPVKMPVESENEAKAMPGKCPDCYRRSLVGVLPQGARLDS